MENNNKIYSLIGLIIIIIPVYQIIVVLNNNKPVYEIYTWFNVVMLIIGLGILIYQLVRYVKNNP